MSLSYNNSILAQTISVSGSNTNVSGVLQVNGVNVSISGHTHTSSNITDFNSSVSGLVNGIYAPLAGATFTGTISSPSGNFTSLTVSEKPVINGGYDYEIHVSQIDGDDTTGNGDLLNPVASITKALTLVGSQRKTIIVHPGTYTESPSITVQYTTITGPGLIGGNILLSGTLSTNTGCTIAGIKMTNLTITTPNGTGNVNILNCEISDTLTKSSNADYTVLRLCDYGAASITGAGLVAIFGGNPNFTTVNNAGANVIIKSAVTVAPVLTSGTLSLVDSVVVAAVTNAITSAASSVITLANCQMLTSTLSNVAPIVLNGFYSIISCLYNKPSSTLATLSATGGSTNSIDYFQYINADKFITQGGTSSQYVKGDGSLALFPDNIVYTSGNQTISGVKTFSDLPFVNGTGVSISGHSHTSSNITDFNSSVSGLLPITNIIAGNGINVAISGTTATITSDDTRWNLFLPSAPTNLSVTGGNGQASLSWTAPAGVIAQAPITDYVVQFSTNSGSSWTTFSDGTSTATSATVTGLTNGTAYVFRVAAVNGVGVGAYTAASSSVTPGIASAPTGLTATAGNAQIALAWTAPASAGSSAITGYRVEYTPSGGSAQTVLTGSTATSYTLTGLTNGTAYTVRVAAVNAVGTGTYTAASSSVTPVSNTDALFSSVSLLSTFNGSNGATVFTDLSNNAASYSSSGVVTDTSIVKYGTASAYFSTTSSQLSLASTSVMPYGTENFCIECWLYPTTSPDDNTLIGSTASNGLVLAWWNGGGTLRVGNIGPFPYSLDIQRDILSLNTWWHLAVTRSGGDLRVFKNGVQQGATASIGSYSFGQGQTRIGLVGGVGRYDNPDVARSFIGYIDDLRITRGQARYVSNFTPPSSQLAP